MNIICIPVSFILLQNGAGLLIIGLQDVAAIVENGICRSRTKRASRLIRSSQCASIALGLEELTVYRIENRISRHAREIRCRLFKRIFKGQIINGLDTDISPCLIGPVTVCTILGIALDNAIKQPGSAGVELSTMTQTGNEVIGRNGRILFTGVRNPLHIRTQVERVSQAIIADGVASSQARCQVAIGIVLEQTINEVCIVLVILCKGGYQVIQLLDLVCCCFDKIVSVSQLDI